MKNQKLVIQCCYKKEWNSFFEGISKKTLIPLQDLKIIVQGKVLNEGNYLDVLKSKKKLNGMALGEPALDSDGIKESSIKYLMEKYHFNRNEAIRKLKKANGSLGIQSFIVT